MENLEQSKQRLRQALERLQNAIDGGYVPPHARAKQNELEIENNDLRATIILQKKDIATLKRKITAFTVEKEQKSLSAAGAIEALDLTESISNENCSTSEQSAAQSGAVTLDELKSMVGK